MNIGDLIVSPFITVLVLLYKALETLPEQMVGLNTILTLTLFAIVIRLIALPFYLHSRNAAEKMRGIQGRLATLKKKYADNPKEFTQAQISLYREAGINPVSGCLLQLIQLPFIFGIYWAVTTAVGGSPYSLLDLYGRVLIPGFAGDMPFPNQFLWIDLSQPDIVLAIIVVVTLFVKQYLSSFGGGDRIASTNWFRGYGIPFIFGGIALSLASGLSFSLIIFSLSSIIQHSVMESVSLRNLFLGREKTRRWQLRRALGKQTLTYEQFDRLISNLLRPPNLQSEDIPLCYKLLEFGARNVDESWPVNLAEKAGKALPLLSSSGDTRYDLTALYHKFAESCANAGHKELAADLASQGFACPQGTPDSRTACVLFLARSEIMDRRARDVYNAFVTDYPQDSQIVQSFANIFQVKGTIGLDMDVAQVEQRMPFNACIADLLPDKLYSWAKSNLGLAHLILDQTEQANRYFRDAIASNPLDSKAVQGLTVVLFRLAQYDESLQIVQDARMAGLVEVELETIGALCQAARWLNKIRVEEGVGLNQVQAWHSQLQLTFPLRRFLAPEVDFIQGRLAEITGNWDEARQYLQTAYTVDKSNIKFVYYYAQFLQISGEWRTSVKILKIKNINSPELLCLRLKQAQHDVGLDQFSHKLAQFTSNATAKTIKERLFTAKYALLEGRSDNIVPWPDDLIFDTSSQADEWTSIWISALIGRGALDAAQKEIEKTHFLRLSRPEQSFLRTAIKWLSGNLVVATKELEPILNIVPNYENAVRLSAAIAENQKESGQTYHLLEHLHQIAPNDHNSALRWTLLRWQKGERKEAIIQLQDLSQKNPIAPLANFWLGRLLLIQATESHDSKAFRRSGECLQTAAKTGIPEAPWYAWLCQARQEHNLETGWDQQTARQLIEALPDTLSGIPIAEVAAVAGLIAVETNHPSDMLAGCALLLNLLHDGHDGKARNLVSTDNLTEALWRTATSVTSLKDQLTFSRLAHKAGESYYELGQVARQIADATFMSTIIAMAKSGENIDEALTQVEEAIKVTPDALMARLARTSLLVKKGEMTAPKAIAYLQKESQPSIAQALEECVHLKADSKSSRYCLTGLAAFLTVNKTHLSKFAATLESFSVEAICQNDEAFLLEIARCIAVAGKQDDTIDLYTRAYELNRSKAVANEFSNYLCYVAAQLGSTDIFDTSVNMEKIQRMLSLAQTYCLEGI